MSVRIQGAEYPLKDIFSDDFVFEIPPYQRPYSWTTEHAGELYEDVVTAMANGPDGEQEPYFLGSVVLAKKEHDPSAKVIDGQQRLTTLTILLAAIAHQASEANKKYLKRFILQEGNPLIGMDDVFRVMLRPRDADFFRRYVQAEGGFAELLGLDAGQLSDPQVNIQANAQLFMDRLGVLPEPERARLAQYLLNGCFLVAVSTPDTESAFKIFAVLNDRGLDLSHADIIKSELIGQIQESEQDRYTHVWETAEEDLGIEAFADLFAHVRMIYAKTKQRESLIKEFRTHVFPKIADPRVFIDEVVSPYADVYTRILSRTWESASNAEAINLALGWLGRIDNVDWIPPAIRYLKEHEQDSEGILRFLHKLERLAASMFIRRVNINARIERYGALLKQIEGGVSIREGASVLELSEDEKSETVRQLQGDLYLERRTRSYVLLRLDEALSEGGARYDHKLITVEHVLPQTPPADSVWTQWFDEGERELWVHKLANLLLLPRRRNSAAQNYDFATKKDRYFSGEKGTSPFAITTQVLKTDKWTPAVLQERQARLVRRLAHIWDLHAAHHGS